MTISTLPQPSPFLGATSSRAKPCGRAAPSARIARPDRIALRRQANSCGGFSPSARATAETSAPGCTVSSRIRAFASADQRRRSTPRLASRRAGTASIASMTVKLSGLDLGADCKQTSRENHHGSLAPLIATRNMGADWRLPFTLLPADSGYSGDQLATAASITAEIVKKPNQVGFTVHPRSWVFESLRGSLRGSAESGWLWKDPEATLTSAKASLHAPRRPLGTTIVNFGRTLSVRQICIEMVRAKRPGMPDVLVTGCYGLRYGNCRGASFPGRRPLNSVGHQDLWNGQ